MSVVRSLPVLLLLAAALGVAGQVRSSTAPTPLSALLAEANASNSQIAVASDAWQAAKQTSRQVSTLPDPTFTYQNLSVGSPKPFAGYTNSDFAYIGLGASQELPYPGQAAAARRGGQARGRSDEHEAGCDTNQHRRFRERWTTSNWPICRRRWKFFWKTSACSIS